MSTDVFNIINNIDQIKHNLTTKQYADIMNSLSNIYKDTTNTWYKNRVLYTIEYVCMYYVCDDDNYYDDDPAFYNIIFNDKEPKVISNNNNGIIFDLIIYTDDNSTPNFIKNKDEYFYSNNFANVLMTKDDYEYIKSIIGKNLTTDNKKFLKKIGSENNICDFNGESIRNMFNCMYKEIISLNSINVAKNIESDDYTIKFYYYLESDNYSENNKVFLCNEDEIKSNNKEIYDKISKNDNSEEIEIMSYTDTYDEFEGLYIGNIEIKNISIYEINDLVEKFNFYGFKKLYDNNKSMITLDLEHNNLLNEDKILFDKEGPYYFSENNKVRIIIDYSYHE